MGKSQTGCLPPSIFVGYNCSNIRGNSIKVVEIDFVPVLYILAKQGKVNHCDRLMSLIMILFSPIFPFSSAGW